MATSEPRGPWSDLSKRLVDLPALPQQVHTVGTAPTYCAIRRSWHGVGLRRFEGATK